MLLSFLSHPVSAPSLSPYCPLVSALILSQLVNGPAPSLVSLHPVSTASSVYMTIGFSWVGCPSSTLTKTFMCSNTFHSFQETSDKVHIFLAWLQNSLKISPSHSSNLFFMVSPHSCTYFSYPTLLAFIKGFYLPGRIAPSLSISCPGLSISEPRPPGRPFQLPCSVLPPPSTSLSLWLMFPGPAMKLTLGNCCQNWRHISADCPGSGGWCVQTCPDGCGPLWSGAPTWPGQRRRQSWGPFTTIWVDYHKTLPLGSRTIPREHQAWEEVQAVICRTWSSHCWKSRDLDLNPDSASCSLYILYQFVALIQCSINLAFIIFIVKSWLGNCPLCWERPRSSMGLEYPCIFLLGILKKLEDPDVLYLGHFSELCL